MKPLILTAIALVLAPACGGGSSGKARPEQATFEVKVSETDPEGGLWDRLDSEGRPDIALCIESRVGKRCYPDDKLYSSQCPDSFTCTFQGVSIPPEEFKVTVIDVDAVNNETVGEATCDWDETCTVGMAKVKIQ
jgi:hypothetical protein